jgi:hypothetical protein
MYQRYHGFKAQEMSRGNRLSFPIQGNRGVCTLESGKWTLSEYHQRLQKLPLVIRPLVERP